MWPTNLMGQLRIQAEMSYGDASFIGYGLCFFILALLTIFFVFTYLKRVLYMAFLTMIAPLVALTYPIDKISDGQAQGFNKWLKEYIFNLLIQPLHLLIYTILVTSAFDLAGKNVLYSLAAIGFLIPAEKLMRSLFGFEKASTPGSLAGAAVGAGLINAGLQRMLHGAPPGKNGKNGKNGDNSDGDNSNVRIGAKAKDVDRLDVMAQDNTGIESNNNTANVNSNTDDNVRMNDTNDNNNEDIGQIDGKNNNAEHSIVGNIGRKIMNSRPATPVRKIAGAVGNAGKFVKGKANGVGNRLGNGIKNIQNNDKFRYLADSKEGQFLKGAGRAIKYTAKQGIKDGVRATRRTVGSAIAKAPDVALRTAAGVVLGGTAATIGAGVALSSDDPAKNMATYAGGALTAGMTIGMTREGINNSNTKTATQIAREKAFYGDKYDEHTANQRMKDWKRKQENKQQLEQYLGEEETKQLYKTGKIDEYLKNEVTDTKDIAALEKLQKNEHVNFNDAMVFHDAHKKHGDIPEIERDKRKGIEKDYIEKFQNRGNTEEQAKAKTERIKNMTHKLESYKKQWE